MVNGYTMGTACLCCPIARASSYRSDVPVDMVRLTAREVLMRRHELFTLLVTDLSAVPLSPDTFGPLAAGLAIYRLLDRRVAVALLSVTGTPLFVLEFMLTANELLRHCSSVEQSWCVTLEARLLLATIHSMTTLLGRRLSTDPSDSTSRLSGALRSDLVDADADLMVSALV